MSDCFCRQTCFALTVAMSFYCVTVSSSENISPVQGATGVGKAAPKEKSGDVGKVVVNASKPRDASRQTSKTPFPSIEGKSIENHVNTITPSIAGHPDIVAKSIQNHPDIVAKSIQNHPDIVSKSIQAHDQIITPSVSNGSHIKKKSLETK